MGKKKGSRKEDIAQTIILATAILQLIQTLANLIGWLIE